MFITALAVESRVILLLIAIRLEMSVAWVFRGKEKSNNLKEERGVK